MCYCRPTSIARKPPRTSSPRSRLSTRPSKKASLKCSTPNGGCPRRSAIITNRGCKMRLAIRNVHFEKGSPPDHCDVSLAEARGRTKPTGTPFVGRNTADTRSRSTTPLRYRRWSARGQAEFFAVPRQAVQRWLGAGAPMPPSAPDNGSEPIPPPGLSPTPGRHSHRLARNPRETSRQHVGRNKCRAVPACAR